MVMKNAICLCFSLSYVPFPLHLVILPPAPQGADASLAPCALSMWLEEEAAGCPSPLSWEVPEKERFRFVGSFARWYLIRILMLMAFG